MFDPPPVRTCGRGEAWSVYGGAIAAISVPLGLWWLVHSVYGLVVAERLAEWGVGRRFMAIAVFVLVVFEVRWWDVLVGLVRAKGSVSAFHARRGAAAFRARRRRAKFAIAAICMASLAALGAAEVVFRVFDIHPPARPRSAWGDHLAVNNTLNLLGIREDWNFLAEDDPRLRIMFLGDSMVYGDGVEADECFCHLVEGLLAEARPEGVVTINAGFPGTAPGWQLDKYLTLRDALFPDVVVHVVYPNDLGIDMHRRLDEIYRIRDDDLWLGEGSYVLRYAERQLRYWWAWKRTIDYFRGGFESKERDVAWAKFEKDVRACRDTAREDGAVYALVLFPWLVRLDNYPLFEVHERMKGVAARLEVPYLDLYPTFAGRDAEKLRVSLANEHPNPEGHRLAAERVARFLQEEVLPSLEQ